LGANVGHLEISGSKIRPQLFWIIIQAMSSGKTRYKCWGQGLSTVKIIGLFKYYVVRLDKISINQSIRN